MNQAPARHRQLGASLIEASIVVAVAGILASSVLPGWQQARERRTLDAASAQLVTDLHLARSLAVSQGRPVRLRVNAGEACYVIFSGPASACSCNHGGEARCTDDALPLRTAALPGDGLLRLSSSSSTMLFDTDRGTVSPTGTLRVTTQDGRAVHHVVNIMGRVRTCSPGGRVSPHPAC